MQVLRFSIPSLWLLVVSFPSPATTQCSKFIILFNSPSFQVRGIYTVPWIKIAYLSFSNNCEQDAVIISVINGFTSVFSATVVYTIIGFRATDRFDSCVSGYVSRTFFPNYTAANIQYFTIKISEWLFGFRNILELLNTFNLAEGTITENNYQDALQYYNETKPGVVQGMDLRTCNLDTFLSEVRSSQSRSDYYYECTRTCSVLL